MTTRFIVLATLVATASAAAVTPRLAHAEDDAEADAAKFFGGVMIAGVAAITIAEGSMLSTDHDLSSHGKRPSLARSARELAFNHLAMSIGATLVVTGLDQHAAFFTDVGAAMMTTALPGTLHGLWELGGPGDGVTDDERRADRHAAGVSELAFALPELAIEGLAFKAAAADPVDDVRHVGTTASLVMAIPSAALAVHGIYMLATPDNFEHVQHGPPGLLVVPTVVGTATTPTLGIGAVGRF